MNNELQLIKTDVFCGNEYSIYSDNEDMYMTLSQLASCLGYSSKDSIKSLLSRNEYLKQEEFSKVVSICNPLDNSDKGQLTRVFTEDGIYEVTMLAKTDVAKEFRGRVRKILKDIRKGEINYTISCAASFAKDRITQWKHHVSTPLIERLNSMMVCDMVQTYSYIYRQMINDYSFDMDNTRKKYSEKYQLPLNECSVIDTIADDEMLRAQFILAANKCITDRTNRKIEEAIRFKEHCDELLKDVMNFSKEFENTALPGIDHKCNYLN